MSHPNHAYHYGCSTTGMLRHGDILSMHWTEVSRQSLYMGTGVRNNVYAPENLKYSAHVQSDA